MAVYTFSTREKRPQDTEAIERVKKYCEANNMNFSSLVVQLVKEWESKNASKTNG